MKTCPFCKQSIEDNNDICPRCQRILVEKITSSYKQSQQTTDPQRINQINDRLVNNNLSQNGSMLIEY